MNSKAQIRQQLAEALYQVARHYLTAELAQQAPSLRPDSAGLDVEAEARAISENMADNIYTTLDVHVRQLLYPDQKQRTDDWLRTQNYMHRRENAESRSVK